MGGMLGKLPFTVERAVVKRGAFFKNAANQQRAHKQHTSKA